MQSLIVYQAASQNLTEDAQSPSSPGIQPLSLSLDEMSQSREQSPGPQLITPRDRVESVLKPPPSPVAVHSDDETDPGIWYPHTNHYVYMGCGVQQISEVDLVHQTFDIEVSFHMRWLPSQEDLDNWQRDKAHFTPIWEPVLDIHNKASEMLFRDVNLNDRRACKIRKGWIWKKVRCQGKLSEKFELENFPFDCQDLPIKLKDRASGSREKDEKTIFRPGHEAGKLAKLPDAMAVKTDNMKLPEWDLVYAMAEFVTIKYDKKERHDSLAHFRLKMKRRYASYMKRIAIVMCVICFSVLLAFAMDVADSLADRLAHCVTILLTATAFQFVTSSSLPQLSYLTLLDQYIMFCFLFIAICSFAIGFTGAFHPKPEVDHMVFFIALGIAVGGHIVFFILAAKALHDEKVKLVLNLAQLNRMEGRLSDEVLHVNEKSAFNGAFFHTDVSDVVEMAKKLPYYYDEEELAEMNQAKCCGCCCHRVVVDEDDAKTDEI